MRALIKHLRRCGVIGLAVVAMILFSTAQKAAAYWSTDQIEQMIVTESLKTTYVRPSLALAVAETESNFRPHVVSHAGAVGIMQIMPATVKEAAEPFSLMVKETGCHAVSTRIPNVILRVCNVQISNQNNRLRQIQILFRPNQQIFQPLIFVGLSRWT